MVHLCVALVTPQSPIPLPSPPSYHSMHTLLLLFVSGFQFCYRRVYIFSFSLL